MNKLDSNFSLYDTQEHVFSFSAYNSGNLDIHNAKLFIYGYKKDDYKVSIGEIDLVGLLYESVDDDIITNNSNNCAINNNNTSYHNNLNPNSIIGGNINVNNSLNNFTYVSLRDRKSKFLVEDFHTDFFNIEKEINNQISNNNSIGNNNERRKSNFNNNMNCVLIPKNKQAVFTYYYQHSRKYKALEFKLVFSNKVNKSISEVKSEISLSTSNNSTQITPFSKYNFSPYTTLSLKLVTSDIIKIRSLKVIPMLDNITTTHEILNSDSQLNYINNNYSKYYSSEKYYVSFTVENTSSEKLRLTVCSCSTVNSSNNNNSNSSILKDTEKENEIVHKETTCDVGSVQELFMLVNSEASVNSFFVRWELISYKVVRGKFNLGKMFKEFDYKFKNIIKFNIRKRNNNIRELEEFGCLKSYSRNLKDGKKSYNTHEVNDINIELYNQYNNFMKITTFTIDVNNSTSKTINNLILKVFLFKYIDSSSNSEDSNNFNNFNLNNYQAYQDNKFFLTEKKILINNEIENLMFDGYLEHDINELKSNETKSFEVTVYLNRFDCINITAIVIDDTNQLIFICPKSERECFFN